MLKYELDKLYESNNPHNRPHLKNFFYDLCLNKMENYI